MKFSNKIFKKQKINRGIKHEFDCSCGKIIIVYTNVYDNLNSGMSTCNCGSTVIIN